LSSFIEWAIDECLSQVHLDEEPHSKISLASEATELWDINDADRFAKLALRYPSLLSYDEQALWKLVYENRWFWRDDNKSNLNFERFDEVWETLNAIVKGAKNKSAIKITRPFMRRLTPGQQITEHGIRFERLVNGDGLFSINVMADGQRIHRVIGRESEGVTRTQAEAFIERVRTEARENRLSLPTGRKTPFTFAEAAKRYVSRLEETNGKNLVAKRRQLRLYLIPFFGSQRLDLITTFIVDRYKRRRKDDDATNETINLELATLSHLISSAIEWGWLKYKSCKIRLLDKTQGRIVALTDKQAESLLEAAVADDDPHCWLFVVFGLNTAMRHREILSTRFDELDLANNRIFVPRAKGGRREQPITLELAAILRNELASREDKHGWIFPSPRPDSSSSGHRDRMSKPFRNAVIRAGLDPDIVTPHVMRHTAITKLVQADVDLPTIQLISGHKSLSMVLRYTHVHSTHIDKAISALGRAPLELNKNKDVVKATLNLHVTAAHEVRKK
jgi:integrase